MTVKSMMNLKEDNTHPINLFSKHVLIAYYVDPELTEKSVVIIF